MAVRPIDKSKPSNRRCWNCKHFRDARVIEEGPYIESRKFYCEISSHIVRYWSCCSYFEWDPDKQYEHPTLTPPNEPLTLEQLENMEDTTPVWWDQINSWVLVYKGNLTTWSGKHLYAKGSNRKFYRRPPEGEEDT